MQLVCVRVHNIPKLLILYETKNNITIVIQAGVNMNQLD